MPHFRPLSTALGGLLALAVVAVPSSLSAAADATVSAPAQRSVSKGADTHPDTLLAGQALVARTPHSTLSSGWYSLVLSPGMVELDETIPVAGSDYSDTATTGTWFRSDATGRFQAWHDRTKLRLRPNGDLTLTTSRGRQLWHSGTGGSGAVRLTLHAGGNLALHARSGKVVWSTHTGQQQMSGGMRLEPGQQLRNAWETAFRGGKMTTLTMQRDGNLVHRCGSRVDWQTHTRVAGSTLRMYRTGVLRVVTPRGRVAWSSHSGGHDHAFFDGAGLDILADGIDLVWYARTNFGVCDN